MATDPQAALRRSHAEWQDEVPDGIFITHVNVDDYDADIGLFGDVAFHRHDGASTISVES